MLIKCINGGSQTLKKDITGNTLKASLFNILKFVFYVIIVIIFLRVLDELMLFLHLIYFEMIDEKIIGICQNRINICFFYNKKFILILLKVKLFLICVIECFFSLVLDHTFVFFKSLIRILYLTFS